MPVFVSLMIALYGLGDGVLEHFIDDIIVMNAKGRYSFNEDQDNLE